MIGFHRLPPCESSFATKRWQKLTTIFYRPAGFWQELLDNLRPILAGVTKIVIFYIYVYYTINSKKFS